VAAESTGTPGGDEWAYAFRFEPSADWHRSNDDALVRRDFVRRAWRCGAPSVTLALENGESPSESNPTPSQTGLKVLANFASLFTDKEGRGSPGASPAHDFLQSSNKGVQAQNLPAGARKSERQLLLLNTVRALPGG
jgi:hypothetical protein